MEHVPRRVRFIRSCLAAIAFALIGATSAAAQGAVISGTVKAEGKGNPLPATVQVQSLGLSVSASEDGRFSLRIPAAQARGEVRIIARFIGFSVYQLDSNLRNSTMVGIVGGGGIGATLFTAYQRFDYDFVLTILLAIIAVIMVAEVVSGQLRKAFQ